MKIRYQYFIFCILLIFLCSCNKTESTKLYDVPPGYGKYYEIAEFERFNSYASENGLYGTKIMVEGKLEDLFLYDLGFEDKTKLIGAYLVSDKNEKWIVHLDYTPYRELSDYEYLKGHIVTLRGHYNGYSDLFSMPAIVVDSGYDRNTGDFFISASYEVFYESKDDSETSDSYKNKKISTSDFDPKTNVTVEHHGVSFEIPKKWADLDVKGKHIFYNDHRLLFQYTEESDTDTLQEFYGDYIEGNIEGLKESIENCEIKSVEKLYFKMSGKEYYKFKASGTIENIDVDMTTIIFVANNGVVTMGINTMQEDEYDYSEDFDKIIDTIIINDDKESSNFVTKSDNPVDDSFAFDTSLDDSNSSIVTLYDMSFRVPNDFKINKNNTTDETYDFFNKSYGANQIVKLSLVHQAFDVTEAEFMSVNNTFAEGFMNSFDNVKEIDSQPIEMAGKNGYLYSFEGETSGYPFYVNFAYIYHNKAAYCVCLAKSTSISKDFTEVLHDILGSAVIGNISQSQDTVTSSKDNKTENGIRPEIKKAIDSYESFFNDYVDFMKKYKNNPSDISLLSDYMDYLSKLSDMEQKFKAIEDEDLTNEETLYYAEVSLRIEQKMLEVLK